MYHARLPWFEISDRVLLLLPSDGWIKTAIIPFCWENYLPFIPHSLSISGPSLGFRWWTTKGKISFLHPPQGADFCQHKEATECDSRDFCFPHAAPGVQTCVLLLTQSALLAALHSGEKAQACSSILCWNPEAAMASEFIVLLRDTDGDILLRLSFFFTQH